MSAIQFDLKRIETARKNGQEIVAVLGLGFVGTAVVANLARTADKKGTKFFVIGIDQDNTGGREKCSRLNQGMPPVYASDESLGAVIQKASRDTQNLMGTTDTNVLKHADVVIFCINLDLKRESGQTEKLQMDVSNYGKAMRMVGEKVRPGTLVTVESTLPIGTCDTVLYPALCEGQQAQGVSTEKTPPLLAYCYERVMPGPGYLDSVNNYWRSVAGINPQSTKRAKEFLAKFVNTKEFPIWEHKTTRAAEMSKLLENAYRATNIAFIEEWAKLAEQSGVDLFHVISSIRVRQGTHDNMMLPGLGVGGYCLTKDALLAAYGAENLIKTEAALPFSRRAILTNESMPLRAFSWVREHFQGKLKGKKAALLGVSYRPGVADTRSTATEILAKALMQEGVEITGYDPLITNWEELPQVTVHQDPQKAVHGAQIVVICLPDRQYEGFLSGILTRELKSGAIVVDPWNMLGDSLSADLVGMGVRVRVYGRGDIPAQS